MLLTKVYCTHFQNQDAEGESQQGSPEDDENTLEFPVANLYELENRVFTESWSIPYKREESLGKCLVAATRLAHEGKFLPFSFSHKTRRKNLLGVCKHDNLLFSTKGCLHTLSEIIFNGELLSILN